MRAISLAKFEEDIVNEDAAIATESVIAVSDGAGGGGVFAERWSQYLVNHLPDNPIKDYKAFDKWIDGIWEPFYNDCEEEAKKIGGLFLNKFYDEGSFATLVAVWKNGIWISYGDSVAFCYNRKTKNLQHSFTQLVDFNNPPYLINCKDTLDEKGFRTGKFIVDDDCMVFAASDTLAHYILMMYKVSHRDLNNEEIIGAIDAQTKNSNFLKSAIRKRKINFEKDVIQKLENCKYPKQLKLHIESLKRWGFIGHDDYSLVIM
ncbi:hypothetical protein L6475_09065 [Prevotella sp. E9-3]|uniref:hypothetical protein n=1 Tax=Prevotella sp. E9-3 TaxID=2913621 RepID=UPI001EDA86A6|nr:hypothetical protein [Prevotella sp. E9-3]UKK47372.1 hypothetical protein L6475_09065 [Prevotella sp. E9-3]